MTRHIIFFSFMVILCSCNNSFNVKKSGSSSTGDCSTEASNIDKVNFMDENLGTLFLNYNNAASSAAGHVLTSNCEVIFALDTGNGTYALKKFKTNFEVDTSFGTAGTVSGDNGIAGSNLRAGISIDKNDNLFLGFEGTPGATNLDYIVLKLKPSGVADTSFGTAGLASFDMNNSQDRIGRVVPLPSGKILLVGQTPGAVGVIRVSSNGALDTTYGTAGKNTFIPTTSSSATAYNALKASDGVYLIGASADATAGYQCMVAKVDLSGDLITSYGTAGFVVADNNSAIGTFDACYTATLDSSNNLFVFGESGAGGIVVKVQPNGVLDTSFDTDGVAYNTTSGGDNYARSGVILDNGKVVFSSTATNWQVNIGITVLNADGSLDTTFSPTLNDVQLTEFTPGKLILDAGPNDLSQSSRMFRKGNQVYLYFTTNANAMNEMVVYRFNF